MTFKRSSKVTQGHERSKIDIFPKIKGKLSGTVEFYICLFSKCGGRILGGWAGKFSRQAVNLHQGNSILLIQPTGVWYCTFCMQNCHFIYFLLFFCYFFVICYYIVILFIYFFYLWMLFSYFYYYYFYFVVLWTHPQPTPPRCARRASGRSPQSTRRLG